MFFLIVLGLAFLLFWARYISTSGLVINDYIITNPNISSNWQGLRIVHISDIHYGRTVNEAYLRTLVDKINALNPDLVTFTGDLIDNDYQHSKEEILLITGLLSEIIAPSGKFAVVGNHDYYNRDYFPVMEAAGFHVLANNYVVLGDEPERQLFLGGIANYSYDHLDLKEISQYLTAAGERDYRIFLIHEGDAVDAILPSCDLDLILGGHSHNGQVRLPFIGAVVKPPFGRKYFDSYYRIGETDIFISNGIGTSTINFRFLNKPSINLYILQSE
ncbi:MAG: metallophosphoesterase [Clostridiales bacterium]|nr:metallophosphoesterase [Clostridiales bacterium]MDR2712215.1 metallophosphoesterase [Clostridiales bacterium]